MGRRYAKRKKKKRTAKEVVGLIDRISLVVLLVSLAAVYCVTALRMTGTVYPTPELLDGRATVRFLDVGQGDCTLVTHEGHVVLIDAGPWSASGTSAEAVSRYAPTVDAFFVTHPHEDHMGAAPEVIRASDVETLFLSAAVSHEFFYEETFRATEERGTAVTVVDAGGVWTFGDITVELYDTFGYPYEDLNDASLILRISVDGLTLIIGGDAETGLEQYAAGQGFDLSADILQVNHHGSSSSTTEKFLWAVKPKLAVVSCGRNNAFGHPAQSVLNRLASFGIPIRRTDLEGTITIRAGEPLR